MGGFNLAKGGIIGPPPSPPVLTIEAEIVRRAICFDEFDTNLLALRNMIIFIKKPDILESTPEKLETVTAHTTISVEGTVSQQCSIGPFFYERRWWNT